jgi:hypothetical protein
MSNTQNNNGSIWPVFFVVLVLGTMFSMMFSGKVSEHRANFNPEPARSSFEHRYAKERVKLEGYSDKEATQAADAIIKFHNAQQARQR